MSWSWPAAVDQVPSSGVQPCADPGKSSLNRVPPEAGARPTAPLPMAAGAVVVKVPSAKSAVVVSVHVAWAVVKLRTAEVCVLPD